MKIVKVVVISVLLVALIGVSYIGFSNYNTNKISQHDEAIIIIPGFFASCLIDDDNIFWDPLNTIRDSKIASPFERLPYLLMDEDGQPLNPAWAPTMKDDIDLVGGATNISYDLFYEVKEKYEGEYDVMMFQYDWRLDCRKSAKQLDSFIKENQWKKVIFLCHSMGGFVASTYLTLGQEQVDKVKMMTSFGTPYLGIVDLLGLLETGYYPFADPGIVQFFTAGLKNIARNMESIFQLMPSKKLLETSYFRDKEDGYASFIRVQTETGWKYLEDHDEIIALLETRPWARYSEDTPDKEGEIKRTFTDAMNLQSQFFYVDAQGIERHVTEKVNSYYFAGTTMTTSARLDYYANGDIKRKVSLQEVHDGTVLTDSALIGHKPDNKRYFLCEGFNHMGLVYRQDADSYAPLDEFYALVSEL